MNMKEHILAALREQFDSWEELLASLSEAEITTPHFSVTESRQASHEVYVWELLLAKKANGEWKIEKSARYICHVIDQFNLLNSHG